MPPDGLLDTPITPPPASSSPPPPEKKQVVKYAAYTLATLLLVGAGAAYFFLQQDGGTLTPQETSDASQTNTTLQYLLFHLAGSGPALPAGATASIDTQAQIEEAVDGVVTAVGQVGDHVHTQLGFSVGPLMFDLTDAQTRTLIADSFAVAEEKNVAVSFHIDDSMFWNKRSDLWSNKNNIEWTDWSSTTKPHRIIGWVAGGQPVLAPQMCYNSPAIIAETTRIARDVIGAEIKKGIDHLETIGKSYLFAGVITGWETRLQDDSQPQVYYGYCALHNLGYSVSNPPADIDEALTGVVADWITLWTKSLVDAGIPKAKVYTHTPGAAEPSANDLIQLRQRFTNLVLARDFFKHAPPEVAYNQYSYPGFSIYGAGNYSGVYKTLAAHPSIPWGISEGTNVNLQDAFSGGTSVTGYTMEQYLGGAFNHGAAYVNLFGWSTSGDAFSRSTAGAEAIAAYRKFLQGESLLEGG